MKKFKKVNKYTLGTKIWHLQYENFDYELGYWRIIPRGKITKVRIEIFQGMLNVYYQFHKEYQFDGVFPLGCDFRQEDCFDSKKKAIAECKRRNALLKKQGKLREVRTMKKN